MIIKKGKHSQRMEAYQLKDKQGFSLEILDSDDDNFSYDDRVGLHCAWLYLTNDEALKLVKFIQEKTKCQKKK